MQLTLINLNIYLGGLIWDNLIKFLKKEDPDILMLQEVFDGHDPKLDKNYRTLDEFSEILSYDHMAFAPAFLESLEGKKIEQGNAIFSKYPLTVQETTFFDVPFGERINEREHFSNTPRNLQHAIAHLPSESSDETSDLHLFNTQGIWGEDGDDSERRLNMARTILKQTDGHTPTVLAGDLNVDERTQTVKLFNRQFISVFEGILKSTFNMKHKDNPKFAQAIVDMVFVTRDIEVIKKECLQTDVSDHLPLKVVLEIK